MGYTTKEEAEESFDMMRKAIEDPSLGGKKSNQALFTVAKKLLTNRRISQHEACYMLTGLPLHWSSREHVYVNTYPENKRERAIFLNRIRSESGCTTTGETKMHFCYRSRPNSGNIVLGEEGTFLWDEVTLFQFAGWCRLIPAGQKNAIKLDNQAGAVVLRKKKAVVTTPYMTPSQKIA